MPFEITAYQPAVKPGAYPAICTDVEKRSAKDGSGDFRVWTFTLTDGTGRTVSASSSMSTTPKSKGGKWLSALLGKAPVVGETVEPVGKPCTILVELNEDGYERVMAVTGPSEPAAVSPVRPLHPETVIPTETGLPEKAEASRTGPHDDLPF